MSEKKSKPRKKRGPGAPLSLDEKVIKDICDLARKGNFRQDIFSRLKLSKGTANSWLDRGKRHLLEISRGEREELSMQAKLVQDLEAAEAESRALLMEDCATSDDPRVKLKFLTLRYGRYFAAAQEVVDGDTGEVSKRTATQILAERLSSFLGDED